MQQRQRIKTVERFQKLTQVIVVATDVAARGIDVKGVDHVVHYQITKSTDTYIHRCGRTARAGAKGVSLALVAETEHYLWSRTRRELGTRYEIRILRIFLVLAATMPHYGGQLLLP